MRLSILLAWAERVRRISVYNVNHPPLLQVPAYLAGRMWSPRRAYFKLRVDQLSSCFGSPFTTDVASTDLFIVLRDRPIARLNRLSAHQNTVIKDLFAHRQG